MQPLLGWGATVTVNVTFFSAGAYQVIANVFDGSGVLSPWATMGTWTVTQAVPAFTMSTPSPSSFTLVTGGATTFTETFQPQNGFNSSVSLSYTGGPAGLTFSPSSLNVSGSSPINQTINANVATGTAPGNYTVTITASGGGVTQTATLGVSVETFTISPPSPTSLTLGQGANTTFVETFQAQNGFSSSVSLSYSGGPSGLTFSPGSVSVSGSSPINQTITATTTSTATPGSYTITVTAYGGGVTQTATLPVSINAAPLNQTDNGIFVTSLYITALGGDPDQGGWLNYVNTLNLGYQTRDQVVNTFLTNSEYQSKYYVNGQQPNNTQFLTDLYQNALNRAPDPAGMNAYLSQLSSGTTRSQIVETFVGLQEFDNVQGARIAQDEGQFPIDVPPNVLGDLSNTTGYRPLLTGQQQLAYVFVTDPRGAQYINSGFVIFETTDGSGYVCPVNFTVSSNTVQVESTGLAPGSVVCTVNSGSISNLGTQLSVTFLVTFFTTSPGNYSILGIATDTDGLSSPPVALGTWGMYTSGGPSGTFTLTGPTSPVSLTAEPGGGPDVSITVTVTGWNNYGGTVEFSSITPGISVVRGSGGPGNATVVLQASQSGETSLTLQGYDGTQAQYLTIPVSVNGSQPTVTQIINSSPPGMSIVVDNGVCTITPCSYQWSPGSTHIVTATSPQTINGAQFTFTGWSDAGLQTHQITVGSVAATYTANYNGPPAPAPTLTLLQTSQTIAAGGATSFSAYISQSASTYTTVGVTSWTGGTAPVIRPSAITGPGWVTVIMYGPSVASTTTYNFNVTASANSGYTQAPATLTVNPTGLQPDFLLSTSTSPVELAPGVAANLPVTIDAIGGFSGAVTFISNTAGVTASPGALPVGTQNVTLTLSTQVVPNAVMLTGTDTFGHSHQLSANCRRGGGGSGGGSYTASPQTATGFADVPNDGTSVTVPYVIAGLEAGSAAANQLISYMMQNPCSDSNTGIKISTISTFVDSATGFQGVYFEISAPDGAPPGPVSTITCAGLVLLSVMLFDRGCTPAVTGVQVNGQGNNIVIAGTSGSIAITGSCLTSAEALVDVSGNAPSITFYPPYNNSPSIATFNYSVAACPQGQTTCSATGQHGVNLIAQQNTVSVPGGAFETNLTVQSVTFGGSGYIQVLKDYPGQSSYTPVTTAWQTNSPAIADPIAYVGGSQMSGSVTFSVNPTVSATVTGLRADGVTSVSTPGQSVVLNAQGLSIPAGQTVTAPVSFSSSASLQAGTAYYNPMSINWWVTPNPNACPQSACGPAGASADKLFVTLSPPVSAINFATPPAVAIPATLLYLATSGGTATTQAAAFQNTWNRFSTGGSNPGPANVTNWLGNPLHYYMAGNGFACAVNVNQLLWSVDGDGQCGSFAQLLLGSLATNGMSVQMGGSTLTADAGWVSVGTTDNTYMLVNLWSFQAPGTNPNPMANPSLTYPFPYLMQLGWPDFMYPPLTSYGDLTNGVGAAGQNSPTPSEKVFGSHFIVKVQSALTLPSAPGPYFDPSYGIWYVDASDFESKAIAGYMWFPQPQPGQAPSFFEVRKLGGGVGVRVSLVP